MSASQAVTNNDYPTGIFTSTLTGNEAFLADHVIQGRKILPGMAYLEMARAAAALSVEVDGDHMIVLSDSVFVQPMIVQGQCAVETIVYPGAPGELGIEVVTSQGVHFQTNARIRDRREQGAVAPLDLAALEARCSGAPVAGPQLYAEFRKIGIQYGPSHQGIETVRLGKDCALAALFLQGSSSQGLDLHPGMLDSVIQSGAVLTGVDNGIRVPFIAKSASIYGPLTDRVYAYVIRTDQGIDFTIADDQGQVRVVITGFVARELDLHPSEDALLYYGVEWGEAEAAHGDVTVIEDQADYPGLVKAVVEAARGLIQAGAGPHVIEVRLPAEQPAWRGIIGLLETIHREYSKIGYRLRVGDRYVEPRYSAKELTGAYAWADHRTVLITGGLGGVGTVIAEDIARSTKGCTLILTGRSELDADKRAVIERLERAGANVVHARCDVADRADVDALIATHPEITGVIHCAGVIRDGLLLDKTAEAIDEVLAPKVRGLELLDEATAGLPLDYFIAVSSIVGVLGNAGQADYAAANGYMDAYLRERALQAGNGRRRGKSIAIDWPLWERGGMAIDPATKLNLQRIFRSKALSDASGLTALKRILAGDEPQVLVFLGSAKAVSELLEKASGHAPAAPPEKTFSIAAARLAREILHELKVQTAEHLSLRLPPAQLDEEADWAEFGFDSIILSGFVNKLNARFHLDLLPTALFDATNMLRFSHYLAKNYPRQMAAGLSLAADEETQAPAAAAEREPEQISTFARSFRRAYEARVVYREEDVAIIGMSCRTAGARNPEELWRLLAEERDMITEIPGDRWDWRGYPDAAKWGSFIDGVDEFDSLFFGISPAEATYMAPEQRLMMQSVWESLENAGCGDAVKGTNTGIFVGCGPSGYPSLLSNMPIESYSSTGAVPSVGPNRISYLMDWHGPSEPIETACSSSLVAVHRAVEAIRRGHCDQAVAGGVNLLLTPDAYVSFTKAGMLCDDGRCKTFSENANGYVRGEGIGMIVLKPLRKALEDGNVIHAVIKGTAENHGGRTNSLTAPNPSAQAAVVRKAIRDAGLEFDRLSYVECHGTGTALGDPVEIEGLKMAALSEDRDAARRCWLGSIKSNIGHLEMAAGIIGLIKVVLQMQHGKIARSLHCDTINRYIDLAGTPFAIAQAATDWEVAPGERRVAGVSSFGFGGVNAHVILEEAPELPADEDDAGAPAEHPHLMVVSARNEESLMRSLAQYPDYLRSLPRNPATLQRLAYTLQVGRAEMQERVVFIVRSIDEWAEQLSTYLGNGGKVTHRNIHRGTVTGAGTLDIGDTQAGRDYLRQLLQGNDCAKVAELWVKGTKIDWQAVQV